MLSFTKPSLLLALFLSAQGIIACSPPTAPHDATYGFAATPNTPQDDNQAQRDQVASWMYSKACAEVWGYDASGCITGYGCGYPGGDPNGPMPQVAGWSVAYSFNYPACTPGSMCY